MVQEKLQACAPLCVLVRSRGITDAQLMVYQLAARTDAGVAGRHESYMAKIAGTELGFRVADRCLQIHGGMGLATEMPISQMWRDARSFMITEGPVEVMRMVLAREIFRGQV